MGTPYLGEIRILSFNFAPKGWAMCNGQLLPINQNQALFSLLGTMYGGDGRVNFALPNLEGRMPIHLGSGFITGQQGGEFGHTLTQSEMPAHTHTAVGSSSTATSPSPAGNLWCSDPVDPYFATPDSTMNPASITNTGGSQPHTNQSPFLVLTFAIALQGIFPSRN
jgi:microcystin-dependent protein